MKRLATDRKLRAILTVLMLIVWPSPVLDARQVSPPPGAGTSRNCEAERDDRIHKAWEDLVSSRLKIDKKKTADIAECQDTFNNVDMKDCSRKYADAMKIAGVLFTAGSLSCAGICSIIVIPAGAVVAPACVTCIAGLVSGTAAALAKALIDYGSCVAKAQDVADKCGRKADNVADAAKDAATEKYQEECSNARIDYQKCKASIGG